MLIFRRNARFVKESGPRSPFTPRRLYPFTRPAMRTARLLGTGRSFYHVMSRVVDRRMVFEAKDKEIFRKILRNQGLRVR
jgi:hypothetical protein